LAKPSKAAPTVPVKSEVGKSNFSTFVFSFSMF